MYFFSPHFHYQIKSSFICGYIQLNRSLTVTANNACVHLIMYISIRLKTSMSKNSSARLLFEFYAIYLFISGRRCQKAATKSPWPGRLYVDMLIHTRKHTQDRAANKAAPIT